jgi:hypothetical protein
MAIFWVVGLCSLVEVYQHFRRACCLHHYGGIPATRLHIAAAQKTGSFHASHFENLILYIVVEVCLVF